MRLRSTLKWSVVAALLVFVAGSAGAQDASHTFEAISESESAAKDAASNKCQQAGCVSCPAPQVRSGTVDGRAVVRAFVQGTQCKNAGSATDGQVGFERKAQLSPAEQLQQAEAILGRMSQSGDTVRRQLEKARQDRDVVKTLCLNDKLSQIDVAVRSARDRQSTLRSAVTRSDAELSNHEFTILTVLKQRAEQLTAEANQCIGEEVAFVGATTVITQIDPTLPDDDTTQYPPTDPTLVSAPPNCISCDQ